MSQRKFQRKSNQVIKILSVPFFPESFRSRNFPCKTKDIQRCFITKNSKQFLDANKNVRIYVVAYPPVNLNKTVDRRKESVWRRAA